MTGAASRLARLKLARLKLARFRLVGIAMAALLATAATPSRAAPLSCAQAAAVAETAARVPAGLLLAIGVVETGRPASGPGGAGGRAPWPWSVQTGGVGRYFDSAAAAVATVQSLLDRGVRSVDIGCFQINLFHHPGAFADLASGFDPLTNATEAARFLASLHDELGAWEPAVAAYHSRTEALGAPYRDMVLASWHGGPLPMRSPIAGIRVWGPAGEIGGAAMPLVAMAPPPPGMWIRMPGTLMAAR